MFVPAQPIGVDPVLSRVVRSWSPPDKEGKGPRRYEPANLLYRGWGRGVPPLGQPECHARA